MSTTNLLSVADLSAGYGEVAVLRNISLEVAPGEVVGLAGANGAGKSSVLRTVSGLLRPTTGEIVFDGQAIGGQAPHKVARSGIAHVPEGRGLFPDLSVEDNLRLGALGVRRTGDLEATLRLFPHLRTRLLQRAGSLSGGEQQMVAIGRGLMAEPKLLMVDELSLGLAPKITREIYSALRELNEHRALGIVVVDQNLTNLRNFVSRLYVMRNGRVATEMDGVELADSRSVVDAYLGGGGPER